MAPDTDLLRDIGFVILGIVLLLVLRGLLVNLIAYVLIAFGVVHMLFRISLDKTAERRR